MSRRTGGRGGRRAPARGARRVAQAPRRLPGRRTVLVALGVAGVALAAGGAFAAARHLPEVPITSVRVAGELRATTREALESAVLAELDGGFFGVDVSAVRDAARRVPWVRDVSVRRVWPDSLHIAVIEREAVARWGATGLLDADGELFRPARDSVPGALILLEGPDGARREVLARYREFSRVLEPAGLEVVRLRLTRRGAWHLELRGGVILLLGQGEVDGRLAQFARAYPALLGGRLGELEQVDLRYTNGFAVRWKRRAETADSGEGSPSS